jgi:phosphotransferase system enzyme I (PtsI)
LLANIGTPDEAQVALNEGADGIGLFRTEFLFMEKEAARHLALISEDTQYEAYKTVLEIMKGKPVVIRTLDAGGDKFLSAADEKSDTSENPLLGQRSIRLTLAHPDMFKTQLRALLRASVHGNLRIMLPLIVSLDEVKAARALYNEAKKELAEQNIAFKKNIPLGIMVETAAAALSSDVFAKHCGFFSIGTNDLTQYSLAIDRGNESVAPLYNEFHLTVLRLIKATVDNARKAAIPVSVCGEMAGMPEGAALLAGFGIDTLSMTSSSISKVTYALSHFTKKELTQIAKETLAFQKGTDAGKIIHSAFKKTIKI